MGWTSSHYSALPDPTFVSLIVRFQSTLPFLTVMPQSSMAVTLSPVRRF